MAEDLKDRVKRGLIEKGLKVDDLGARLNLSPGEISRLLLGVKEPIFSQLCEIAKMLDIDLHELISDDFILVSDKRLKKAVKLMGIRDIWSKS